ICFTVGLPEEVAHIAMAHSGEGELLVRSLECMIVHRADYTFWNTLLVGDQLKIETVPPDRRKYVIENAVLRKRCVLLEGKIALVTGAGQGVARSAPQ